MSRHTPGPWTCNWTRAGKMAWKIVGSDRLGVATILVTQLRESSEKEANARLIAAAPELLEALHRCKFDSLNMSMDDLAFCRSAYAKATGHV